MDSLSAVVWGAALYCTLTNDLHSPTMAVAMVSGVKHKGWILRLSTLMDFIGDQSCSVCKIAGAPWSAFSIPYSVG